MNIIVCGAGEVGRYTAEVLSAAGHAITVIDQAPSKLSALDEVMDVRALVGSGTHAEVLREAGCKGADLFVAATHIDEVNLLAGSIAKAVGARQVVARVHHSAFYDHRGFAYDAHLGIDRLVCPEHVTALAIASTLRSPGALAVEQFARGRIEMQSLRVSDRSKALGRPLRDVQIPGSARLAAIERESTAFLPTAETVLKAGDIVTLIGPSEQFDKVRRLFTNQPDTRRRIIIVGGTTQAVWLCRALRGKNFSIRLFEEDPARAEELAEKLDWVTVLNADAVHTDVLEQERVDQLDSFAALTGEDEQNILVAARAKSMGVHSAVAVLQRATYLHLVRHVGIDWAFSPRSTAVSEIKRLIEPGPVRTLATLAEDIADVYEITVPAEARHLLGKPLKQVRLPDHCMLATVQRGEQMFVPGAESSLEAGDLAIAIGPPGCGAKLGQMFAGA